MKKFLEIKVLTSERTVGSWKAITEQVEKVLGFAPMRIRDQHNKMGVEVFQKYMSSFQSEFERGIHPTDRRWNPFSQRVEIHKGDWVMLTSFGGLVLTDDEYRTFVREDVR